MSRKTPWRLSVEGKAPAWTRGCMDYGLMKDRVPEPTDDHDSCAQYAVSGGKAQVRWPLGGAGLSPIVSGGRVHL